ncbi:hypothetical protein PILCRDRAFT_621822 [Piloderma croceum F 1598]|uniref:Cytochrome P450 n=1 Tax=Piloderma croceum (strain F 1598) TaxID=765440 RepID=A0A0C3FBP1_PILCF|nr:hypothetical protein PILCRDRAFT_621822 [Piloderma croceum F 1598]
MRADVTSGKKSEETGLKVALLRNLVEANMTQDDDYKSLTDDELLSNIFAFLLAGHETSAHTLSFALPLLTVYPDVQHKIFEEVLRLWPQGCLAIESNSSYKDDFPKLEYTTAFFRETLRMFPSAPRLPKQVHADATITAQRIAIPKGSVVIMDVFGTNLSPLHWGEDAAEFKPERFIDTDTYRWPRDAFLTFSAGARGCIGSRFAMTESVCILALLVRQYEILVPSDLELRSKAEQRDVLLKWTTGLTITPTNSRVRLRRRF